MKYRVICVNLSMIAVFVVQAPETVMASEPTSQPELSEFRHAEKNILISDSLPAIRIRLEEDFTYIGRFKFTIADVARGERLIFVDAKDSTVQRLFIAQFEEILPTSDEFYRYNFDDALELNGHRFRQNIFAFSHEEALKSHPTKEAALTVQLLRQKGFRVEDEIMASRFLTVPDSAKRHELILFYLENVQDIGLSLSEIYEADDESELILNLTHDLTSRSLESFIVE